MRKLIEALFPGHKPAGKHPAWEGCGSYSTVWRSWTEEKYIQPARGGWRVCLDIGNNYCNEQKFNEM